MSLDAYNAYPNPPNYPAPFAANYYGQGAPGANYAGLLQVLAQANDFTWEDLQANRQGWLTQRQQAQLARSATGCIVMLLIIGVSVVCAGGLPAVLAIGIPSALLNGYTLLALALAGLAAVALGVLFAIMRVRKRRQQLREARAAFLDGFVERQREETPTSEGGHVTTYSYVLYNQQQYAAHRYVFSVNGAAYHALVPGLRYRVYYLPGNYSLLSIEPLP